MPGYAAVVAEVAQKLGMTDGVFVGWSLGGHIVLEAHNLLPDAAGFVILAHRRWPSRRTWPTRFCRTRRWAPPLPRI